MINSISLEFTQVTGKASASHTKPPDLATLRNWVTIRVWTFDQTSISYWVGHSESVNFNEFTRLQAGWVLNSTYVDNNGEKAHLDRTLLWHGEICQWDPSRGKHPKLSNILVMSHESSSIAIVVQVNLLWTEMFGPMNMNYDDML